MIEQADITPPTILQVYAKHPPLLLFVATACESPLPLRSSSPSCRITVSPACSQRGNESFACGHGHVRVPLTCPAALRAPWLCAPSFPAPPSSSLLPPSPSFSALRLPENPASQRGWPWGGEVKFGVDGQRFLTQQRILIPTLKRTCQQRKPDIFDYEPIQLRLLKSFYDSQNEQDMEMKLTSNQISAKDYIASGDLGWPGWAHVPPNLKSRQYFSNARFGAKTAKFNARQQFHLYRKWGRFCCENKFFPIFNEKLNR